MRYYLEIISIVQLLACVVGQSQGTNCTMEDTGAAGACTRLVDCQTAMAMATANKSILPQKCAAEEDLVCCSDSCPPVSRKTVSQQRNGSKAADYCIELSEKIFPCQQTTLGWTRGDLCPLPIPDYNVEYDMTPLNTPADAPHYGRLGQGQRTNIFWLDNPVILLSDRWVVCSAYAFKLYGSENMRFVGLGGRFTTKYIPDSIYSIARALIHPKYNGTYSPHYNDIALLQLDRQVIFTSRIIPACLHTGSPLPPSGLVFTGSPRSPSDDRKTIMDIVPLEECSRILNSESYHEIPGGVKQHLHTCSRPVNSTAACPDWYYGAPLTLHNGPRVACTNLLVGILTTYDYMSCTLLYTQVSGYVSWIESVVWP